MKRFIALILGLIMLTGTALPFSACAEEEEQKVVRVGWYESSFCSIDRFGRRCGIDYEYQSRISAYTGWTYEYVEDSWPNLLQMLIDGEIDLLSDVSYTEERTELMLFPDLPMGSEAYYIYIDPANREITAQDLTSFNGKKIGVNKASIQEGFLKDWAERNGLTFEIIPLVAEESESMQMVLDGELDGYAAVYSFGTEEKVIPAARIGSSNYYYAVNKRRPDLLAELNMALAGIHDEDPYFNQRMSEEHLYTTKTTAFLTPSQEDYLKEHGTVRVGYRDHYLPFCQVDDATGELTGALSAYLAHAANSLKDSDIQFEAVPYATTQAALDALAAGEVDCIFPAYLNTYNADEMDFRLTSPAMKTEMNAVRRISDGRELSTDSTITFAVTEGDPNVVTFIQDQFPLCSVQPYEDVKRCFEAVSSGEADCVLVNNYRIPDEEELLQKYKLYSVPTGENMPLSFALKKADSELYFILNKTAAMTKSEDMDSALASYIHFEQEMSLTRFLKDNWIIVLIVISAVFLIIVVLLYQKLKAERRANEQQRLLEEAAQIADLKQTIASLLNNMPGMNYTKDANTGVYLACNQAFAEYAHQDSPDGVTGHTDAELFDARTAAHFAEDDRIALSMDEPYIFYEDLSDAAGNTRQFQTTKQKYTDDSGRLCLLGMCQDVTDMVRIQHENATTKEAYEKARSTGIIYTHIAQTLARGYSDLYYINLDTEEFVEYRPDEKSGTLIEARRGWHFFEECKLEIEQFVHPDDRDAVIEALDRKTLVAALDRHKTVIMTYRMMEESGPTYVTVKISRMQDDERYIILGVTNVDEQVKQQRAAEQMQEEQIVYGRLKVLAGDFIAVYVVSPETGRYREFSATSDYDNLEQAKRGRDFFKASRDAAPAVLHPEDLNRFVSVLTKENMLAEIEKYGIFTLSYRVMMEGRPRYVQLKAALVEEKEGKRLIVGINDIDAQVRQEEEYVRHIAKARIMANIDPLTSVKNRHAYLEAEERLNEQIAERPDVEFAIVLLDVNDLKRVNDTAGHQAGDQYIKDACKIICDTFKHSPVFRIGGDEFAVIVQGSDYACIDDLVEKVNEQNEDALKNGGIVIACGMAKYENDEIAAPVLERADRNMYENKSILKSKS